MGAVALRGVVGFVQQGQPDLGQVDDVDVEPAVLPGDLGEPVGDGRAGAVGRAGAAGAGGGYDDVQAGPGRGSLSR
ncbi:hypothetical protein NQP46_09195 [Streptomyces albus]|nr:hypothetical protein NQP46_09195 [Streptomyces albus]